MPATAGVPYLCKSDPPSLTYTKQPEQRGPSSLALSSLEQKSHRRHNSPTPHLLAGPWRAGWSTQQSPVGAQCSLDTLCCSNVGRKHRGSMTLYHVFTVLGNFSEWCLASLPLFPSYLDFWLYWKQRQPVCHLGQVIRALPRGHVPARVYTTLSKNTLFPPPCLLRKLHTLDYLVLVKL